MSFLFNNDCANQGGVEIIVVIIHTGCTEITGIYAIGTQPTVDNGA
jgi:hypothetical protein